MQDILSQIFVGNNPGNLLELNKYSPVSVDSIHPPGENESGILSHR